MKVLAGGVLVVALAGAGWLVFGKGDNAVPDTRASVGEPAEKPASGQPATPAVIPAQHTPAQDPESAAERPSASPADNPDMDRQAQAAGGQETEQREQQLREEKSRRKAEQDARRMEAEKERRRAAEDKARAEERFRAEEKTRAEEAKQRAQQQQAAGGPVQQACGKYSSAISRSLCETRECSRPSLYDTPYCVEFRKRYGGNEQTQGF